MYPGGLIFGDTEGGRGVWVQWDRVKWSSYLQQCLYETLEGLISVFFKIFTLGAVEWPYRSTGHHTPLKAQLSLIHQYSEDGVTTNEENYAKWEFSLCLTGSEIYQMFSCWGTLPCTEFVEMPIRVWHPVIHAWVGTPWTSEKVWQNKSIWCSF